MSEQQLSLIHTANAWLHFIGGYYKNTDRFIDEAIKSRISRRAPAQMVRNMQFGDRLILLRYERDQVYAFAEAQIIGITLDHEIAQAVGEQLAEKATYQEPSGGAGQEIERECGSYFLMGTWTVNANLQEVLDIALKIAEEKRSTPLIVMINAELMQIYESRVYLNPAPKFTRGFTKVSEQSQYYIEPQPMSGEKTIFSIRNYSKKPRPSRSRKPIPALPRPS